MDEFSFIAKYLKPLAAHFPGSLNLSDDAALIAPPPGCELVITKDAVTEGVHFLGSEPPELIAAKALRVNLSDLAAMGATPLCYFLALMLPKNTGEEWLENFAHGLAQTQKEFSISLAGGDTTATGGKLAISITAIGTVPTGQSLKRSGAKEGDDIYVSGTLGDSALGLELLQQGEHDNHFINRYLLPQPRIELGIKLRTVANACMDISDGLAQDLGHICAASNVGAVVYKDQISLSDCHPAFIAGSGSRDRRGMTEKALTHGDDYELLFTAPLSKKPQIEEISKSLSLPITCIGKIIAGNTVKILDASGTEMILSKKGFRHF
jgi:thiamine-monophosphate kinase